MRERPKALQPVFEHNQRAFDQVLRWKRQIAVGAVLLIPLVAVLVPRAYVEEVLVALFVMLGLIFTALELWRTAIFRRDLRERGPPTRR